MLKQIFENLKLKWLHLIVTEYARYFLKLLSENMLHDATGQSQSRDVNARSARESQVAPGKNY